MNKIVKAFFYVFSNSLIPNFHYYHKLTKTVFRFSLKYFFSLILLINFIFAFSLIIRFNPSKILSVIKSLQMGLNQYPKDLVISINQGYLRTNYYRPYFLRLNYQNKTRLVLVIDESAQPEKIYQYKSLIMLTPTAIVTSTPYLVIKEFSQILPVTAKVDYQIILKLKNQLKLVKRLFPFIYVAAAVGVLIVLPTVSFIATLFYLLIVSFFIFIFFKVFFHKKFHYKKILQISFHAVTLPLILDYFFIILKPTLKVDYPQIFSPLLFFFLLSVFVFAAVYEACLKNC